MIADRIAACYRLDNTHGRSLTDDYQGTYPLDGGLAVSATGKIRESIQCIAASSTFRSRSDAAALRQMRGVCLWVKFTSRSANMTLVAKGGSSSNNDHSLKLWYQQSDNTLRYTVGNGSTATTVATTGLTLANDQWYFVRAWCDATDMGIEIDGTVYGTATSLTPVSETGTLYLGRDTSGNYLNGYLDEVTLFSVAPTKSDGAFLRNGGDGAQLPEPDSLPGPLGRAGFSNPWTPPSFAVADNGALYVAHGKRRVQRHDGFGEFAAAGVPAPLTKDRITGSGNGTILGDIYSYTRFLDADGRTSSMSPLSDVAHVYGTATGDITNATNASPIVVTSASHGLSSGDRIRIVGQKGLTAMNGEWFVTVLTSNTFELDGSVGNGDWQASQEPTVTVTTKQDGRAGVDAVQSLSFSAAASGGTFTLTFRGETSSAISATASAATVQTALRQMGTIGSANVSCSGGALGTAAVLVTFTGTLGDQPIESLTADTANVLGASVSLSVATLQEGSPGADEVQTLNLYGSPSGGTFTLTFDGQTTSGIAYNANAATIQAALEALSNIGVGDVTVTGGPLPGSTVTVTFGGALANTNVAEMTANPASLTGGTISVSMSTVTAGSGSLNNNAHAFWKMNESSGTRSDSIGAYDLTEVGSTTSSTTGLISSAAYIKTPGSANDLLVSDFALDTSNGYTVSVWFYAESTPAINIDLVRLVGYVSGVQRWAQVHYNGSARVVSVTYYTVAGGQVSVVSSSALAASSWHHIVMTVSTGRTATLYVDGASVGSGTIFNSSSASQPTTFSVCNVGRTFSGTTSAEWLRIDESGVWDAALSSGSISTLYNSGAGTTTPFAAGTNEVQRITVNGSPSQGSFTLTYAGQTSGDIAYNASASTVDTALEALSNIGAGDVTCTGGPLPGSTVDIEFTGSLAATNVSQITANDTKLKTKITTTTQGNAVQNEIQRISASPAPTGGTFTLTYDGQTTSAIAYNATAATVDAALEALSNIGAGDVSVTGGPLATAPFVVTFQNALANTNVAEMTGSSSMTGAVPTLTISTSTAGLEARNEIQEIVTLDHVESGTWSITGLSTSTSTLNANATAAEVEIALEAIYGTGKVSVTGNPLTSGGPITIEWISTYAETDVAEVTISTASLRVGGWGRGASELRYEDVPVPDDTRVVRRQILRSLLGDADVFYIDIDTTDITSTIFTSTKTDDDLINTLNASVVLLDADGVDHNLARHGEPPNWKAVVQSYQNRVLYGVDYVERDGAVTTDTGSDITGRATDWPDVFDGRTYYGEQNARGYEISSINRDDQTAASDDADEETGETTNAYAIRMQVPDNQRIYHSWLLLSDAYPESVHAGEPFQINRDDRAGEMTAMFCFDGRLFVGFEHQLYRYQFDSNPAQYPDGDGTMTVAVPRGAVNHRCVIHADDVTYIMDKQGVYRFTGDAVTVISQAVKPLFTNTAGDRIWWENRTWFHGCYFPDARTLRWFVSLDGSTYPKHAICFNIDSELWWTERFDQPITASVLGATSDGRQRVFLGSTGRKIYTLDGLYEGIDAPAYTMRGTATSAGLTTLTDTTATFSSDDVGLVVRIVSGTGVGQARRIEAVTSTMLRVDRPWVIRPSTDSVYQIAGIPWVVRTGTFASREQESETRGAAITWEPVLTPSLLNLTCYTGMTLSEIVAAMTTAASNTWGFDATANMAARRVDLARTSGYALQRFDRPNQIPDGRHYYALQADGVTNGESVRLYGIAVAGVS